MGHGKASKFHSSCKGKSLRSFNDEESEIIGFIFKKMGLAQRSGS